MLCDLGQVPSLGLPEVVRIQWDKLCKALGISYVLSKWGCDITCLDWTCPSCSPRSIPILPSSICSASLPALCHLRIWGRCAPRASWSSFLWKNTPTHYESCWKAYNVGCFISGQLMRGKKKRIFDIVVAGKNMRKPLSLMLGINVPSRYPQESITETPSCLQSQLHFQSFFLSLYCASPAS